MEIDLWGFQAKSVDQLRDNFRAGVKSQLLVSPTGSGKTRQMAHLLNEVYKNRKRGLFLVDRLALIKQTCDTLTQFSIPHGVTHGSVRKRPWEKIHVATVQTLESRYWEDGFWDLVIYDEAHTSRKWFWDILKRGRHRVVGPTATPFTRGLKAVWQDSVSVTTTNHLIHNGPDPSRTYLSPFIVYAPSRPDMTGAKVDRYGEWTKEEAATRSLTVVGDCVAEYTKHAFGKKFIFFGATIAHCEEALRQFMGAGIVGALYTSNTPEAERVRIDAEFRKPDSYIKGLFSVAALAKGFDVADVECGIFARPLRRSLAEWIQMFGRILRYSPGKTAIMLDHSGNFQRFEAEMMEFFETGEFELDDGTKKIKPPKKPKERTSKKCPRCSRIHDPAPHCPSCGFEYQRRSDVIHLPGELKKTGGSASREHRWDFYAQLLYLQHNRRKWAGWAEQKYREKFGAMPPMDFTACMPKVAGREVENWVASRNIAAGKAQRFRPRKARAA